LRLLVTLRPSSPWKSARRARASFSSRRTSKSSTDGDGDHFEPGADLGQTPFALADSSRNGRGFHAAGQGCDETVNLGAQPLGARLPALHARRSAARFGRPGACASPRFILVFGVWQRLPDSRNAVRVEILVDTHDREPLFERLGREQSIKRIAMVKRERGDASQVGYVDRKQFRFPRRPRAAGAGHRVASPSLACPGCS
jgi:hypothetical protein